MSEQSHIKKHTECGRCHQPTVLIRSREHSRPCEPREVLIRTDAPLCEDSTTSGFGRDGETYMGQRITGVAKLGLDHGMYVTIYPLHTPVCPKALHKKPKKVAK